MPSCADIKVKPTSVLKLDDARKGKFVLDATNAVRRSFTARADIKVEGQTQAAWIALDISRFEFGADKTQSMEVTFTAPPDVPPGKYSFHVQIVDVGNPDEFYSNSDMLSVEVPAAVVKKTWLQQYWWVLVIVGGVVVIGGGVAAAIALSGGGAAKAGESCDGKDCAKDLKCDEPEKICRGAIDTDCKNDKQCLSLNCDKEKQVCTDALPGAPCGGEDKSKCPAKQTCVAAKDANGKADKICLGALGFTTCKKEGDCVSGNCEGGTCAQPAPLSPCPKRNECPSNQSCLDVAPAGLTCFLNAGERCKKAIECSSGWCNQKTNLCTRPDDKCAGNDDCPPPSTCSDAKFCLLPLGKACATDAMCQTAICDGGKCVQSKPCLRPCAILQVCQRDGTCGRRPVLDSSIGVLLRTDAATNVIMNTRAKTMEKSLAPRTLRPQ